MLSAQLKQKLQEAIAGRVIFDEDIDKKDLSDFVGADAGWADACVKASCRDDVAAAVKFARAHDLGIVIRAAGTNLVGNTIPNGGLVLDVSGLDKILELDKKNNTILVEPGVKLCDLQQYVESQGLFYPPDPAEKNASIGGNIATNAGGMRAIKYGVTRDYVLGLEVVDCNGNVLTLGSKNLKDATGLALKQLLIGSEGTLGVITKCLLRLIAKPEAVSHALVGFESLQQAIGAVQILRKSNLQPTAVEFVEKKVIAIGEDFVKEEFPLPAARAYLIVSFDGKKSELGDKLQKCSELLIEYGATDFLSLEDETIADKVWRIRAALARAVQASGIWEPVDTVVPLEHIADFVQFIDDLSCKRKIRILPFGHAGDGNVHLCILKDDLPQDKWPQVLDEILDALYDEVYALHGLTAAEHGIGRHKRRYFLKHADPNALELMRKVKHAFDPCNLFNRGCSYNL